MRSVAQFVSALSNAVVAHAASIEGNTASALRVASTFAPENWDTLPVVQWHVLNSSPVANGAYGKGHSISVLFACFDESPAQADIYMSDFLAALDGLWRSGYGGEAGILTSVRVAREPVYEATADNVEAVRFAASVDIIAR